MYRETFRGKNILSLASFVPLMTDCVWDSCLCVKRWRLAVVSGNDAVVITEYSILYYVIPYHIIATGLLFPKISNVFPQPK